MKGIGLRPIVEEEEPGIKESGDGYLIRGHAMLAEFGLERLGRDPLDGDMRELLSRGVSQLGMCLGAYGTTERELGDIARLRSYATVVDDIEAACALIAETRVAADDTTSGAENEANPRNGAAIDLLLFGTQPTAILDRLWKARWCDQGFPTCVIGHKLCAMLAATSVTDDVAPMIRPPWRAFRVRLPSGMFSADVVRFDESTQGLIRSGRSAPLSVLDVHVVSVDGQDIWHMSASSTEMQGPRVRWPAMTAAQMSGPPPDDAVGFDEMWSLAIPGNAAERRLFVMMSRVALGMCLYLSDPTRLKPINPAAKRTRVSHPQPGDRDGGERVYQVVGDVSEDVRDAVDGYLKGGQRVPSVQTLVRGHWKRQVCGGGGAERKFIHVQAYWRGPMGAPVGVRAHQLGSARGRIDLTPEGGPT